MQRRSIPWPFRLRRSLSEPFLTIGSPTMREGDLKVIGEYPTGADYMSRVNKAEEAIEQSAAEGLKYDDDKPRMDLLPPEPLFGAARVFKYGADKYADRNWELGISTGRLFGALLRHLWAWWHGEEFDEESQHHHLDHAMCCLMMLHATYFRGGEDTRWTSVRTKK